MIIYLDNEELQSFLSSAAPTASGTAYEWEGEDVVHLHIKPLEHAFGRQGSVLFTREEPADKGGADYVVIASGDAPRVLAKGDDGYREIEANLIPARTDRKSTRLNSSHSW